MTIKAEYLSMMTWLAFAALTPIFCTRCMRAQGYSGSYGEISYYDGYVAEFEDELDIDDSFNLDAYAEIYPADFVEDSPYWVQTDLTLYENDDFSGKQSDSGDYLAEVETEGQAFPLSTYEADINFGICSSTDWWDEGDGYYCDEVGGNSPTVQTGPGQPNIDSVAPGSITVGDQQLPMSIYGQNLVDWYGIPSVVASPVGFSFQGFYAESDQIIGTYSVAATTDPNAIGYLCVSTGGGTACSPDIHINPQTPTSLPVVSDNYNMPNTGCPAGMAGWARQVVRQLTDQNGNPVPRAGDTITETVNEVSNDLLLPPSVTGSGPTDSQGRVRDSYNFCSSVCFNEPDTPLVSSYAQVVNDGQYPLGTYAITKSCTQITVQ